MVRGGTFENPEGSRRTRNVVIEFPDYAPRSPATDSPEYQANIKVREPHQSPTSSSSKAMTARSPDVPRLTSAPAPLYRRRKAETSMSDMRLIVAGAGGRMGRTLIKAIAETPGLMLAGATEGDGLAAARPGLRRARRPAAEPRQS